MEFNYKRLTDEATADNLGTSDKVFINKDGKVRQVDASKIQGVAVTGTLSTGSTTLTLTNSAITTDSTIDVYTDDYKISPKNVTVTTSQIVLEFKAQSKDVNVKVVVR